MKRSWALLPTLFLALPACGDSPSGDGDGEVGTGDVSSSSGEAGSEASTSGSGEATSGTTEGTTTGGGDPVPAKGISITEVEANQITRIPIGLNGDWVDGNGRNTRLVSQRDTLIRVHHVLEPGWTPRLIEAVLDVHKPGGEVSTYNQIIEISQDSDERFLDRGFFFGLVADEGETEPGTSYQVRLFEVDPSLSEGLTEAVNVTPTTGPGEIGFEGIDMAMKVMFVPFNYTPAGTTPDLTDPANQRVLEDQLFMMEPIRRLEAEYHAPVSYSNTSVTGNLGVLLSAVDQVRNQDGAPSNWYYVGLIDTGQQSGVVGIAPLGGNINANLWRNNKSSTAGTVVHEIGHNLSLNHVACTGGNSAGDDPSYPDHPLGRILNTGFGLRDFQIYGGENTLNYMTYCGPVWTDPWTINRTWNRIQSDTAQGDVGLPQTPVLRHAIYADGTEEWWTSRMVVDPDEFSFGTEMSFVRDGKVHTTTLAKREVLSDDSTVWISAPIPEGEDIESFDTFRELDGTTTREVSLDDIKVIRPRETH